MSPDAVIDIGRTALTTVLLLAAPMLLVGMTVGLIISIFQAATQINEQTMTFVPKIVAVMLTLLFFGPWLLHTVIDFTTTIFQRIATIGI